MVSQTCEGQWKVLDTAVSTNYWVLERYASSFDSEMKLRH